VRYDADAKEQLRIIKLIEDDAGNNARSQCNVLWELINDESKAGVRPALRQE
jgi:hypothetical protein